MKDQTLPLEDAVIRARERPIQRTIRILINRQ
jgi:hypothetical protein